MWGRIQSLAEGSCLPAFQWGGGGGAAGGRPWTPDLPTDSALVLYLFAAFIDAPGWEFAVRENGASRWEWGGGHTLSMNPPLYLDSHSFIRFPLSAAPLLLPPLPLLYNFRGMPLFLGQLPPRPPNQYSAILTYRPERPSARADAILALNLSGTVPLMCFLAEGRILALTGYHVRARESL